MTSQQPGLPGATNENDLLSNAAGSAAVALSPFAVVLAAAPLLVNAAISAKFSLGWHKSLAVACIRSAPSTPPILAFDLLSCTSSNGFHNALRAFLSWPRE